MKIINDYKRNGLWVRYVKDGNERKVTEAGRLWGAIQTRTKVGGSFNKYHSTTEQAVNGFKDFQEFAEWCNSQEHYRSVDLVGKRYELDKDILGQGSKYYSPETCCFVPQHINKLLNEKNSQTGDLPLGVSYHKATGKFSSRVCSYNKRIWLGIYDDPKEASKVYCTAKSSEILRVLRLYPDICYKVYFELHKVALNYSSKGDR